ncbi:MAG: hypothetical protein V4638_06825 [Bacteroidota bacterium]
MTISTFDAIEANFIYLWIWHADKIPPHIGCSVNGSYFSLKVNGLDLNFPVDKALGIIKYKSIPSLLIQTTIISSETELSDVFLASKNDINLGLSCLSPVRNAVGAPDSMQKIKDLIDYLHQNAEIKHIFGLNLKDSFVDIPEYSIVDIQQRLAYLSNVKG